MLLIFDVDGTLVDSQNLIYAAQCATFAEHGLPAPSREKVLSLVGLSLGPTFEALVGKDGPVAELDATYRRVFNQVLSDPAHHEPLFPDVTETLRELSAMDGVTLGIATGKSVRGITRVMKEHGWEDLFTTIQTADTHPSKPHPSMVLTAMQETGKRPEQTCFIGDTAWDMRMAKAAEVAGIGVDWGYHPVADLQAAGAGRIVSTMRDLVHLVRESKAQGFFAEGRA
jgi:phosphoglycolate phosphatase